MEEEELELDPRDDVEEEEHSTRDEPMILFTDES